MRDGCDWAQPRKFGILKNAQPGDEKCERDYQAGGSYPVINIPTVLLLFPIFRNRFRTPFCNPVIDRHGTNQRKQDREDLYRQRDGN